MATPNPKSTAVKGAKKETKIGEKTIIFFDWDDTLQASSVLVTHGISLQTPRMPRDVEILFAPLQDQVIKLIDLAFSYTKNVFVITNAEHGWVELASQKFMPKVNKHITNKLPIVSARTTYQDRYPNQPNNWKKAAFSERINAMFSGLMPQASSTSTLPPAAPFHFVGFPDINIISFGDSECERTALLSLTKTCHSTAKIKSIKFVERPSVEQLKRQLQMVESNFNFIVKHETSLDLMLQISTVQTDAAGPSPSTPIGTTAGATVEDEESDAELAAPSEDTAGILDINHGFNNPYLDANGKPIDPAAAGGAPTDVSSSVTPPSSPLTAGETTTTTAAKAKAATAAAAGGTKAGAGGKATAGAPKTADQKSKKK